MSVDFSVDAEPRDDMGKGASRRLRRSGRVPAIIYGGDEKPTSISLDHNKMFHSLENEAFFSHIITVNLAGKQYKTILRDLQRHPAKPKLMHMDFQRINADEALTVHVPLHFMGEDKCPGVKLEGGSVTHNLIEVEISCLPQDIPEFIEVDVSELKMGDSIHLSDLVLPKGVTLTAFTHGDDDHDHDQQVLNVHATRVTAEEEETDAPAAEEDGEADAETES